MTTSFIAEISSNHNQDLDRCLALIDCAAEAGCNGVKFQLFKLTELFAPEVLEASEEHRRRRQWELPLSFLPHLAERCKEKNILFGCTPFYLDAVAELLPYVDFLKIASYELLWTPLLAACGKSGKPVVLSTGMATMDEVTEAVMHLNDNGCRDLTLLHCVSSYPAQASDCNLAAIAILRNTLQSKYTKGTFQVGWSDHSVDPGVMYRAVHKWSAAMVEFHLDLDGTGVEFSQGHCWLPNRIKDVIDTVRKGYMADGNSNKTPTAEEIPERPWRADPDDGLRPCKTIRSRWKQQDDS